MSYLAKAYLCFDAIYIVFGVFYFFCFLKSKEISFFYLSTGGLLMLLTSPIIIVLPEAKLNFWLLFFLLPGFIMISLGIVIRMVKYPYSFFRFVKLSELPDNRKQPYRKDLLIYGAVCFASGVVGVIIYKRIDFLTASAALLGAVILFIAPTKIAMKYYDNALRQKSGDDAYVG